VARSRKKSGGDEGGGANWMDTYGDLVTLLLCFFVMLFASSTISESKWKTIVESFTGTPPGTIIAPIDMSNPIQGFAEEEGMAKKESQEDLAEESEELSEEQLQTEEQFNELYEKLNQYVVSQGLDEALLLTKDGLYIYMTIVEGILFNSGKADIRSAEAEAILDDISMMLADYVDDIAGFTIEGHTDNDPINTVEFIDNLDLSSKRANNVARYMSGAADLSMSMFESLGRGEWDPIASNDTPEGKERNRRVNVIVVAKDSAAVSSQGIGTEVESVPIEPTGPEPEGTAAADEVRIGEEQAAPAN
jgi:chemotaxis protein MotB